VRIADRYARLGPCEVFLDEVKGGSGRAPTAARTRGKVERLHLAGIAPEEVV
jgi:hypothetical protein